MAGAALICILLLLFSEAQSQHLCGATSCYCDALGQEYDYHLACPSLSNKTLDIEVSMGQKAQIICDQQYHDQPEKIFEELQKLSLGHLEKLVLQDCPLPPESWSDMFMKMGIENLRRLEFNGGEFATSRLGNLLDLKMLEIKYMKSSVHLNDTKEGLPPSLISITIRNISNLTSDPSPFSSLKNLRRLYIQNSKVQMSQAFFNGTESLVEIGVENTNLETLPKGFFDGLLRLKKLNLKRNNLRTLPEGVFHANSFLETVNLSDNCLETLPDKAFKNLINMKEFSMVNQKSCSDRKLNLPSDFLPSSIEKVEFAMVKIQKLPQRLLQNCPKIKEFRVQTAELKDVPENLFSQAQNIEIIDLAGNEIKTIKPRAFNNLPHLEKLRLHFNKIEEIDKNMFVNTRNIRHIELQHNLIRAVDDELLLNLPQLQSLNLGYNLLEESPYHNTNISSRLGLKLERLILSNNKIKNLKVVKMLLGFSELQVLDVQHNQLTGYLNLTAIDQVKLTTSLKLNFDSNKLDGVIFRNLVIPRKLTISIENNSIKCDCYAAVIKEQENFPNLQILPSNFPCEGGTSLVQTKSEELLCPTDQVGANCVQGCECEVNTLVKHVRMTCDILSTEHLTEALHVYRGWSVDLHVSSVLDPRLRVDLGGHNIRQLHLSNIDLEEVHLESIPETVRVIRLDNNKLKSIPHTIRVLQKAALNMRETAEERFEVGLGNNPWQCNCDNVELLHFAQSHYTRIKDQVTFECDHLRDRDIRELNIGDLCSDYIFVFHIIGVLIPIICILIIGIIVSYYRDLIIIYVFSKPWGKLLVSEEALDKDKSHDVFISYSHEDAPWVEAVLLPGLERPEDDAHAHYRCLVHSRDWVPGEAIPDQILGSVESSRRTVIVLSRDFVTSMWSNMEFRTAHSKAIKENIQRVVIILVGEMPELSTMNEDLKKYIKSKSFIDSEDSWFWRKLRYSLSASKKASNCQTENTTDDENRGTGESSVPYYRQFSRELLICKKNKKRNPC